jgi:electron transfer flavoprotein alpha subunit
VIALVPVRDGALPAGAEEVVAECGGRALLVGAGAASAAKGLAGLSTEVQVWETEGYRPAAWSAALAPVLAREPVVVLPASADGRDLAPRLAHRLGRPLLAGAMEVTPDRVVIARWGGLAVEDVVPPERLVATLEPGVRGFARAGAAEPAVVQLDPMTATAGEAHQAGGPVDALDGLDGLDAIVLEVLPPDPATMDLAEAPRIVAGGAGLESPARFAQLAAAAEALGASLGATRVVTDRGWVGHERQIGTTGVVVDPRLYLAFGISGAVQHTSGLGQPDHIISVNTDPSCPMMQLADLAVVSDANAVLDELVARLAPAGSDDTRAASA